jgi:hypothetical protein
MRRTYYIFEGYDRRQALAICKDLGQAKRWARELSKRLGTITVRDALGGLRLEINPDAPEQHQIKETK